MKNRLHRPLAKWAAGFLMMIVLSLGIYTGILTYVAVGYGTTAVLTQDVATDYEYSAGCAQTLAEFVGCDISNYFITRMCQEICPDRDEIAMYLIDYDEFSSEDLEATPYTYRELMNYREDMNDTDIYESDEFFYDEMALGGEYVAVKRQTLIDAIILNADEIDGEQYRTYEAYIGESFWEYDEYTGEITCSRFGTLNGDTVLYYNYKELNSLSEQYLNGQDVCILAAKVYYFDTLVNYYTADLVTYEQQLNMLRETANKQVNYRFSVVLNDGTCWTNVEDASNIFADASYTWSYDYASGDIVQTPLGGNDEYLLSQLETVCRIYDYTDASGDSYMSLTEYLQNNASTISISIAENMRYDDQLKNDKEIYEKYLYLFVDARQNFMLTIIFAVVFLILFVYLLLVVGYEDDHGTLAKTPLSFRMPTEMILILSIAVYVIAGGISYCFHFDSVKLVLQDEINTYSAIFILTCWVVLPAMFELYSRIRHKQFLARSVCYRWIKGTAKHLFGWAKKVIRRFRGWRRDIIDAMRIDIRLSCEFLISQLMLFIWLYFGGYIVYDESELGFAFLFLAVVVEIILLTVVFRDIAYTAKIIQGVKEIENGNLDYQIPTEHMKGHKKELAQNINHLRSGLKLAVEQSIKDERLKTELITNVSHDIKTPLTSIINYIDLLKKEPENGEHTAHYLEVLDQKSQRLKQLMEDLVELSKSATGNVEFTPMRLDLIELLHQVLGEFKDKFSSRNLTIIENFKLDTALVNLDSRHTFRVFENLCQNIYKYAMENSRVYVDVTRRDTSVQIVMKNMSQYALNISEDELMERFVRGDASRNTSGSGLGLSIAKNLVTLQQGAFYITLDGDLFKVTVTFPLAEDAHLEPEHALNI